AQRPSRTFAEQQTRMTGMSEPQRRNFQIAQPLKTFAAARTTPTGFEQISPVERQRIAGQSKDLHAFRDQRAAWESRAKGPTTPTEDKGITPPTVERRPPTPVRERRPDLVPPRDVHITQPEEVKIPSPPIIHRPAQSPARESIAPSQPSQEHSHVAA